MPTHPATGPVTDPATQFFGLAPALRARMMGFSLAGIGVFLAVATLAVLVLRLPTAVMTGVVVVVLVAVFSLGFLLVRRWYVVRLDPVGYRVRFVRGAGVTAGRWLDVEDMTTAEVAGARCVVLRLRDGRTTTVPVDLIEGDPEEFVRVLGRRLDEAGPGRRRSA
ncbi:MAG: hypothetical protein ACRDPH_04490 [Marmoricola sp.]